MLQIKKEINEKEQNVFRLCNLNVQPGEKIDGFLEMPEESGTLPVAVFHGKEPGKTVLITAGIHAGEYVGIQAAVELSQELNVEDVKGTIILVKVANRPAFELRNGSMGVNDGKNLNRVFPGNPEGTEMERLAWFISCFLHNRADYYIDLHGGDTFEEFIPYVYYAGKADEKIVEISRKMAQQANVPYMIKSDVASGGSYNYAASIGIPSILIERGGMGKSSRIETDDMKKDIKSILRFLGIYHKKSTPAKQIIPKEMINPRYEFASCMGFWYPYKKVGEEMKKGEILGEIRDYSGKTLEICRAPYDGIILYQTGSLQVTENGAMIAYGQEFK